jgi:phage host-nuclease inhibitor protein Gam
MAPPRRKAPKQEAPQTLDQAIGLISEYRDLTDKAEELKLDASAAKAKIDAAFDAYSKPLEVRMLAIFRELRAWWGVAAPELTEGKRKSTLLAGCSIGERTTPPALKLTGITLEKLAEELQSLKRANLLRVTTKVDKPSVIKALQADDGDGKALAKLGASIRQTEEFFIDWPKPAAVEIVPEAEPAD